MEDSPGSLWVGSDAGVFRLERVRHAGGPQWQFQAIGLGQFSSSNSRLDRRVIAIQRDRAGCLWMVTGSRVYRLAPGGEIKPFGGRFRSNEVVSFAIDSHSRIWVGTGDGLFDLGSDGGPGLAKRVYTTRDGLPGNSVRALFADSNGSILAGTKAGLTILATEVADQARTLQTYSEANGLPSEDIQSITRDRDRNIWVGTNAGGVTRIAANGFTTYGIEDGLVATDVTGMFLDRQGNLCVVTKAPGRLFLNRFDGRRFLAIPVKAPARYYRPEWLGWYQVMLESQAGEWWAASIEGLLRLAPLFRNSRTTDSRDAAKSAESSLPLMPPRAAGALWAGQPSLSLIRRYDERDGLAKNHVHQIFEDSHGFLWISTRNPEGNAISRWDPESHSFRRFSESDGLPNLKSMRANGFFEDRAGQIWIGLHRAGVLRYRRQRFEAFSTADGVPAGGIRRFYQDQRGRLWIGSGQGGVARIDNPEADRPKFVRYSTAEGLSGNEIQAITEGRWGRIYIGTGHGVDRLDPDTGRVRWYTTADGLAPGEIQAAIRDLQGKLWFGTVRGVSSFVPTQEPEREPPSVRIMALRVGADSFPVADNGATDTVIPDLAAGRNEFQADFLGLSFAAGETIRYQYRLEGLDRDWSQPSTHRSVIYGGLSPGRYRFVVRAINSYDVQSTRPAVVSFHILPPFWMRWWFVGFSGALLAVALYALHRRRLRQVLELERVRTRIAADLHDGIGASLSEITIAGELATRKCGPADVELQGALREIAETSREAVKSMTDIVWAIDPDRDHASDLAQRMRQFASEICMAGGVCFEFRVQDGIEKCPVRSDVRRDLLLFFKECVHNALRHSGCTAIRAELAVNGGALVLSVADDGKGFEPEGHYSGSGLKNMMSRARRSGGCAIITSRPGAGTTVVFQVPVHHRLLHEYAAAAQGLMGYKRTWRAKSGRQSPSL